MRKAPFAILPLLLLGGCDFNAKRAAEMKHAEMEHEMRELEERISILETQNRTLRAELDEMKLAAPVPSAAPAQAGRCQGSGFQYRLAIADYDGAIQNLTEVSQQVRIVPFFDGGVAKGFKVYSIRPDSLVASCGLQNGDVVQRVNGMELTSPDKALDAYAAMKNADRVTLSLVRQGAPKTLTVDIER